MKSETNPKTVMLKDYIIDMDSVSAKVTIDYEVVLENNTDFIVKRRTLKTDRELVVLVSKGIFYIKDCKTDHVDPLTETNLSSFLRDLKERCITLHQVHWLHTVFRESVDFIMNVITDEKLMDMCRHNVLVSTHYPHWYVPFWEQNSKLFMRLYNMFPNMSDRKKYQPSIPVILDASGIGSMDITAADGLGILYQSLKEKGIRFYMTEHIADLNEQLRKLGLGYMIEEGSVRRTIHIALKDMGIKRPYPLEGGVDNDDRSASRKRADNRVQEFVWAFGTETEEQIEKQILLQIEQLKEGGDVENLLHGRWSHMEAMDEDEWLEHLEEHLKEIVNISGKDEKTLARRLEEHRREVHDRIATEHPELAERFKERRHVLDEHLKQRRPEVYELVVSLREKEETDLK